MQSVNDMPAGRELDALVAERVMGYIDPQREGWNGWKLCGILIYQHVMIRPMENPPFNSIAGWMEGCFVMIPEYSTDVAEAWKVAEKLGLSVLKIDGGWQARRQVSAVDECSSNGETAPIAICRAALKASAA